MAKPGALRFLLAFAALALAVAFTLLPEEIGMFTAVFAPVLILTMLSSILSGWYYAAFIGLAVPLIRFFLKGEDAFLPTVPVEMLSLAVSGIVTGVCYNVFRKAIISVLTALFAGRSAFAFGSMISYYLMHRSYTLLNFWTEAVTDILPGLLLALLGIPLLIGIFRKLGFMQLLRGEPEED